VQNAKFPETVILFGPKAKHEFIKLSKSDDHAPVFNCLIA